MQHNKNPSNAVSEKLLEIGILFAICFLVVGASTAYVFLGGRDFLHILFEPPSISIALGISQIIGSVLAILFIFFCFGKKLRLNLLTFILFGAFIGLFSSTFAFLVSAILCGNSIYLISHHLIQLFLMPFFMRIETIFNLGLGFINIICGAVSGALTYYLLSIIQNGTGTADSSSLRK